VGAGGGERNLPVKQGVVGDYRVAVNKDRKILPDTHWKKIRPEKRTSEGKKVSAVGIHFEYGHEVGYGGGWGHICASLQIGE